MIKKTMSILLIFMVILTIAMPTNVLGESKDYTGHWAEETIQSWLDEGYVTGYPDGSFKPEGFVTRAEFVKMVNNLFGFTETAKINFTDVNQNEWYYQEVQKAFNAGYINGVSETRFAPNDILTREQAAVMVSKIMNLEESASGTEIFSDSSQISVWAKEYVGSAAEAQLIKGYDEDKSFRPKNPIKRAEAVVILDRALNAVPPALYYAEYYEENGQKYLYLLFDEDIDINQLFSNENDLSKITGPKWGAAKVDLSWSDNFDDEVIIELADDTILSKKLNIAAGSLVDDSKNINKEISSCNINFNEENLTVLNTNVISYVSDNGNLNFIETYDNISLDKFLNSIKPTNDNNSIEIVDENKLPVSNSDIVNNSMLLRLYNIEDESIETIYKISVRPTLNNIDTSIINDIDNGEFYINAYNGVTVGQVINSISSQSDIDLIQIVDNKTFKPISDEQLVDESMSLYIEVGGWDWFYYDIYSVQK